MCSTDRQQTLDVLRGVCVVCALLTGSRLWMFCEESV